MKKILIALIVTAAIVATACSLWGSINARKLLANCKFEVESFDVEIAKFNSSFVMKDGKTRVKMQDGMSILKDHWSDIKKGKFNLDFTKMKLRAHVVVDNPNDHHVILDSLVLDAFMEGKAFSRITHAKVLEIPAKTKGRTSFLVDLPIDQGLLKLMDQKTIQFKGTVWSRLKITDSIEPTIPIPVELEQKIPHGKIQKEIKKGKKKLIKQTFKKIQKATGLSDKNTQDLKKKAEKYLEKVF